MANSILRLPQVIEKTGLPRSSVYWKIRWGEFPTSIKLGERSVGWLEQDVDDWIKGKVEISHSFDKNTLPQSIPLNNPRQADRR